jgi:hypothetical protein
MTLIVEEKREYRDNRNYEGKMEKRDSCKDNNNMLVLDR